MNDAKVPQGSDGWGSGGRWHGDVARAWAGGGAATWLERGLAAACGGGCAMRNGAEMLAAALMTEAWVWVRRA
jgi:hypothetical protein